MGVSSSCVGVRQQYGCFDTHTFIQLSTYEFHVISYKSIDRSLKSAPVVAIPVNPFCWSKSAKHDATLTSLTADLLRPGS